MKKGGCRYNSGRLSCYEFISCGKDGRGWKKIEGGRREDRRGKMAEGRSSKCIEGGRCQMENGNKNRKKATNSRATTMRTRDDSPSNQGKSGRGREKGKERVNREEGSGYHNHINSLSAPKGLHSSRPLQVSQNHQSVEVTSPTSHLLSESKRATATNP